MTARAVVLSKEKDMLDVERNKQNVVAFYDLMFNQCRPREAIEESLEHLCRLYAGHDLLHLRQIERVRLAVA